jgi:hypothetical protein
MEPNQPPDQTNSKPADPSRQSPPPPKRKKWLRIGLWAGGILVVCFILLVVVVHVAIKMIVRSEVSSLVAQHLNATVEIDGIAYDPPLTLEIAHARLYCPGPNGTPIKMAELGGLHVSLASLPLGGPIVVDNCVITDPAIVLVRLPSGQFEIGGDLLKPGAPSPASSGPVKISSFVRIRHLEIDNLTVQSSDYASAASPTMLARMDVTVDQGGSPSQYQVHATLSNKPLTDLVFDAAVDVDGDNLTLKNLTLTTQIPNEADFGQIPQELQPYLKQYRLAGSGATLTIANGGTAAVDLTTGRWTVRDLSGDIKFSSSDPSQLTSGGLAFTFSGGGPLPGGEVLLGPAYLASLDADTQATLKTDSDADINLRWSALPQPVTNVGLDIEYSHQTLSVESVRGRYGDEPLQLVLSAQLAANKVKLQNLRLDAVGGAVLVDSADADLTAPYAYNASVAWEKIDLRQMKTLAQFSDPGGHISGSASGELQVSGTLPPGNASPLASANGKGNFQVHNGDFYEVKLLDDIIGRVAPGAADTGRIGDAAGRFTFKDGTAHFTKLAVSSPIIGIQGSGDVGMTGDNPVDLNLIVAPLGDWKKQVEKTGIPLLGQVAASVQKVINNAQKALYSFHVTGPATSPSIQPAPSPVLDKTANDVFGKMLNGGNNLLDLINPGDQDKSK